MFSEILHSTQIGSIAINRKPSGRTLQRFYAQLGSLLEADIDLLSAVNIATSELKNGNITGRKIVKQLKNGQSLLKALKQSRLVSEHDLAIIDAGEKTGRLSKVLLALASYHEKRSSQQRQMISALAYPVLVILTLVVVVYFLLNYMVPMFQESFRNMHNGSLPLLTRAIIKVSESITHLGPYLFVLIATLIFLLLRKDRSHRTRKIKSQILMNLPVIRGIVIAGALSRFASIMSLFISSSLPLNEALKSSAGIVRFYPLELLIRKAERKIMNGSSIFNAFSEAAFIPRYFLLKIRSAEQINGLEKCFTDLATQLNAELEHKNVMLKNILEPALILIVGVICGLVVIGMYLPIVEMSTGIN